MIETPRLTLRPFRPADRDAVVALLSDPEVMRFSMSGPKPADEILEDLDDWAAFHRPGRPERWAQRRSRIVWSRSGPVDTMSIGAPMNSCTRSR